MGFYINEYETELKQHLNLSNSSWRTITEDNMNFLENGVQMSFSGFLNKIFSNFYLTAKSSISQQLIYYNDKMKNNLYDKLIKRYNNNITTEILDVLSSFHEKELLDNISNYSKGYGKKFRINKKNLEILRESQDSIYYSNNIGAYLKSIFEEYSSLPMYQREAILYKENIDLINSAITSEYKLKITLDNKVAVDNQTKYSRKFYLSPYKLTYDDSRSYNYITGVCEEILPDGTIIEKRIASFRVSRLCKITILHSMKSFISNQTKNEIEKALLMKTSPYLVGEIIDIKVAFSKKGLDNFSKHIYMRPKSYELLKDNIYIFHCTEVQALNYFFKFGNEVNILEPSYLREKFINRYKEALESYLK